MIGAGAKKMTAEEAAQKAWDALPNSMKGEHIVTSPDEPKQPIKRVISPRPWLR